MEKERTWRALSLSIDNYIGNRNKKSVKNNPSLEDIEQAIRALNGKDKSSLCVSGIDDSVFCVGGGLGRYHVQVTLPDSVFVLCDPSKPEDQVNIVIGSVQTPLPANYITGEKEVLAAVRHYFRDGNLAPSLRWVES